MTRTLTRAEIADAVYQELGLSHVESAELVDAIFEEISLSLERGNNVKLSSFGTFNIRRKSPRIGRNPRTKEEIPISARSVVTFHSSNILTKSINS